MTANKRIVTLKEAANWREKCRKSGRIVVVTNGCFDLLHRGHVEFLTQARRLGHYLVVLVNDDDSVRALKGNRRPVQSERDRAVLVAGLRCVDRVVVFHRERCDVELRTLRPDVYVKSAEYAHGELHPDEAAVLSAMDVPVAFLPVRQGCSTSGVIDRILELDMVPVRDFATHTERVSEGHGAAEC